MSFLGALSRSSAVTSGEPVKRSARLVVDVAVQAGARLLLAGWCNDDASFSVTAKGRALDFRRLTVTRPDVLAADMGLPPSGQPPGFALVIDQAENLTEVLLRWRSQADGLVTELMVPVEPFQPAHSARYRALGGALVTLLSELELDVSTRLSLVAGLPRVPSAPDIVSGYLDTVVCDARSGFGVASGWLHAAADTPVWLENEHGMMVTLAGAFRSRRDDVVSATMGLPGGGASGDTIFMLPLQSVHPRSVWRLNVLTEQGVHTLGEALATGLPADPLQAFRQLCAMETPVGQLAERTALIDLPLLAPIQVYRQRELAALPVLVQEHGPRRLAPKVSVIVPLYGRFDFTEPQLLKFSQDPWLCANAELIYVIDDPTLLETMRAQAPVLSDLYGVGFKWLWGGANRGFAGANNLGVRHANAPVLLFVNSDVFPQRVGWAQTLVDVLDRHPEVGVVAPRLLYGDGSLQHAGMRFNFMSALGIWVNQHPWKGLDAHLDPLEALSDVPAVTGACMALRRADLDAVGGWDEGYLIGDFEDSDLCLKLRERGARVAYCPEVSLVHLERQSMRSLGGGGFRTKVMIHNAVRHQMRWAGVLPTLARQEPTRIDPP